MMARHYPGAAHAPAPRQPAAPEPAWIVIMSPDATLSERLQRALAAAHWLRCKTNAASTFQGLVELLTQALVRPGTVRLPDLLVVDFRNAVDDCRWRYEPLDVVARMSPTSRAVVLLSPGDDVGRLHAERLGATVTTGDVSPSTAEHLVGALGLRVGHSAVLEN